MARTDRPRVLVLGGTAFVGRAVVEEAVARGWDVTVLNRGHRRPPRSVTVLVGDREEHDGLAALARGEWDVVVDTWSWDPAAVRRAAETLVGRVGQYSYVSSRSVYAFPTPPGAGEDAPLVPVGDQPAAEYATAKVAAEQAWDEVFEGRALLARAGLILGRYENVGRLPWWLARISRGGSVLAPGPADLGLQFIDVRDLALWMLDASLGGLGGPFNAVSPPGHTTMADLLRACVTVTGSDASLRWVDPAVLKQADIRPWTQLPIWLPPGPLHAAMHQADTSAARAAGLVCRPAFDTVADTWRWLDAVGDPPHRSDREEVGLDPQLESRILDQLPRQPRP